MVTLKKTRLEICQAQAVDIPEIVVLSRCLYKEEGYTDDMVRGQINNFPRGQFVVKFEGKIVGHCATFMVAEQLAFSHHNWKEITGNGFASRHDPHGDYLYGLEVCVDERYRGLRIGRRLYDARKQLCEELNLKGIVFGGGIPGYWRRRRAYPEVTDYVQDVIVQKVKDPVMNFHINNGFRVIGILHGYLPEDRDSGGYATHMIWDNPAYKSQEKIVLHHGASHHNSVRLANVQFQIRKLDNFEHLQKQIEYFVDTAADYQSDFVCFPEYFTLGLLTLPDIQGLSPIDAVTAVARYEKDLVTFMEELAISYNINIIGGSHPTVDDKGVLGNAAFIFLRDGATYKQQKLHCTPNEVSWWNMHGGDSLDVIQTDCGPIGVLICYDSEFPETARHLADQGALILFVPFCTDQRQGYLRVRYCCQARAIENQLYVVMSGLVGNIPDVENVDIHYAQSMIVTPCDFPFARDGIAAEAASNTEMIIFADLQLDSLHRSRSTGSVTNFRDRRFDLYRQEWTGN